MKLSIIIPVFNSEKYLNECLASAFSQDLMASDYEVIIINDGSTDRSKQIILNFKLNHENLIFVDQKNQGVSTARNAGLKIASGEYITFMDSDDKIVQDSLSQMIAYIEKYSLDILYGKIETYDEQGNYLNFFTAIGEIDNVKKGFEHKRRTFPPTFYQKEIIKELSFNSKISFGEDTVFNAKAQAFANRVSYFDLPYYQYTVRENSLSKQGDSNKAFEGFLLAIKDVREFQNANFHQDMEAKNYFDKVYFIFVTRIVELNIFPTMHKVKYLLLKNFLVEQELNYILNPLQFKYPYVHQSFFRFATYQKFLNLKSKVYRLLYKNA
ncbi:glycosyltransferase [Kaistella sp. G5-32]|uniref:Glycosyltransferase n=1 Tax=Kaistella gelatinilytica TaxID=2787636 RepID=A0ABS0FC68_9FLAO|nr:glycosyltransferase [Kaistella gelatinilytica]MBF8457261.1 glycosyltransferase [Kaistella gelatinilytica]